MQWRGRIEYQPRFSAMITNELKGAIDVFRRFRMKADDIGAGFCKIGDEAIDGFDHQVDVNRYLHMRSNCLTDERPDCQIGNIMIVHDIEMDDIGAGCHDVADFFTETGKVGGQNARSDAVSRHVFPLLASGEFYLDEAACLPRG